MIDGEMVDLIQGDSGSFCYYGNEPGLKLMILPVSSRASSLRKLLKRLQIGGVL